MGKCGQISLCNMRKKKCYALEILTFKRKRTLFPFNHFLSISCIKFKSIEKKNLNFKVVDSNTLNYIALQEFIILKEK